MQKILSKVPTEYSALSFQWLMSVGEVFFFNVQINSCHTLLRWRLHISYPCCLVPGYQRSVAHSGGSRKRLRGVDPQRDQASGEAGTLGREVPPEGGHPWVLDRWYVTALSQTLTGWACCNTELNRLSGIKLDPLIFDKNLGSVSRWKSLFKSFVSSSSNCTFFVC